MACQLDERRVLVRKALKVARCPADGTGVTPGNASPDRWWEPRRPVASTRLLGALLLLGGAYSFWLSARYAVHEPTPLASLLDLNPWNGFVLALFLVGGFCTLAPHRAPRGTALGICAGTTVAVAALNWMTSDTTFTGLVCLMWPASVAAHELRRAAAYLVTGIALAAVAVLAATVPDWTTMGSDLPAFALTAVVLNGVLIRSQARTDRLLQRWRREAAEDPLTGLATRRVFDDALVAAGDAGQECAVLLADVDEFKQINDRHGHTRGDQVLREVAAALRAACPDGHVVARLGGDELAVLLRGPGSAASAPAVAERFRRAVADGVVDELAAERPTTVSIGVAVASSAEMGALDGARALVVRGDEALYAAKRAGRNRISLAS